MAVLEDRQPVYFGDGYQSRDFTYVTNNIDANILAATSDQGAGMVFNIACGTSYSLRDLLAAINAALGKSIEAREEPARVGDVKHSKADVSLAREVLGYEASVSFEKGIRRTIEWYRENG